MGFRTNAYAAVWSAKENGKVISGKVTVSKKNKDNVYENTFDYFANFCGDALKKIKALDLPEKIDREHPVHKKIKIKQCDVTTYFNADKYKKLLKLAGGDKTLEAFIKENAAKKTFTIFDFELAENEDDDSSVKKSAAKTSKAKKAVEVEDEQEDDLPF